MKLVVGFLVVSAALACAPDDRHHGPFPKEIAGNAVKPTDPTAEGQFYFFHDSWGTEVQPEWPPADFMVQLQKDEPGTFGDQFASFGFLHDDADPEFPVGLKRGLVDHDRVHETCAMCHTAELPDGTRWIGAPNLQLDPGRFRAEVNDRWVAAGHPPLTDDVSLEKLRALGPGRFDASSGDYPAAVPAAFPTYFTLKDATHLNYMGTGKDVHTEATFAIYTFGAGQTDGGVSVPFPSDDKLKAFLDFFGSIPPPAPPSDAVHDPRVGRGRQVFHEAQCDACHHLGERGKDGVIPTPKHDLTDRIPGADPEFPRGTIGTDREHRILVDGDDSNGTGGGIDPGYADLIWFVITRGLSVDETDGYRVTDLRGLSFTAPYLHNDSVPTLEDLLSHADERPTSFVRDGFVVNTFAKGNGNGGHEFGVDLSNDDKAALIAFLKTL